MSQDTSGQGGWVGAAVQWAGSLHAGAGLYHTGGLGPLPVCMVVTHRKSHVPLTSSYPQNISQHCIARRTVLPCIASQPKLRMLQQWREVQCGLMLWCAALLRPCSAALNYF